MIESIQPYAATLWATAAIAGLIIAQGLVADFVAIARKHVPGTPVDPDHNDFLFRAVRAQANTNETVAVFLALVLFCIMGGASALWTNVLAWVYIGCRAGHMLFYYTKVPMLRSTAFTFSLLALIGMLGVGAFT